MKVVRKDPPRRFAVGAGGRIVLSDCGDIRLLPDEQVTFVAPSGRRYDLAAKEWGFYATPSVNGRLRAEGFRTALVRNPAGRRYVVLVEEDRMAAFREYLREEGAQVEEWLDER